MELQNAKEDKNEKSLEALAVENAVDAWKDVAAVVEAEAEKDENEVVEASAGEIIKEDEKFVENSMDVNPEEAALKALVGENKAESVEEASALASVEASSSGMNKKPQGLGAKTKIVKKVKKVVKRVVKKGTAVQVAGEENVTGEHSVKESADPSLGESEKEIKKIADSPECSSGKEKVSETSVGGNDKESKKKLRKVKAKAKLRNTPSAVLVKSGLELEGNTGEADQQKTGAETDQQKQLIEGKTGLAEGKKRRRKRRGKQVLDSNKKPKTEVGAAADVIQQRTEEKEKQLVESDKKETNENGKEKIGGLIFMCNAKTRPDCFRFSVMGVSEKKKDVVMSIKPGLKLFLYDYDLKLLYGIFQASSAGGMKLERNAFGGSFPAQVRFKVFSDCIPLPESEFKIAIRESYNKNKFKTELTHQQVFKLKKLFRPAPLPAQVTHTQPIPVPRDADRKRSDRNRYAPGSSRTQPAHTHERRRPSPPARREEPPRDLFLSEREYRTFGLRREPTQQYAIPPPDASYRDRMPLESYHSSMDRDRLLRQAEIERHDRREVRLLPLPERDYQTYDHPSSRLEIHALNSANQPASIVALDSYRRDRYYEYRAPEMPPRTMTYLASTERPQRTYMDSSRREDDDLYSRYVTPDSLADYYRESRRYIEPEFPSSQVSSRYAYSGSLPFSHR